MLTKCLFQTMKHKLYNPKWNFFNVLVKLGYVGAQSNREFWRNEIFNNKDKKSLYIKLQQVSIWTCCTFLTMLWIIISKYNLNFHDEFFL